MTLQLRSNREARRFGELYAQHRRAITELLTAGAKGRSLAVLGAGNALDLDGDALGAHFGSIHLVDVDEAALSGARARLGVTEAASKVTVHPGVDVTGAMLALERHGQPPEDLRRIEQALDEGVLNAQERLPRVDVVLSDCVLSQTFCTCEAAWPAWSGIAAFRRSVLRRHLILLARVLAPGGTAFFLTDVAASSPSFPLEHLAGTLPPARLIALLAHAGKLFDALDPIGVQQWLRAEEAASIGVRDPGMHPPWTWRALPERTYLVVAHSFSAGREP